MIRILIPLLFIFNPPGADIGKARILFLSAVEKEEKAVELLNLTAGAGKENAVLLGYQGIARTLLGKHAFNPVNKVNYFNKGKKILETALSISPDNVELRYLRLTLQENVPSFLGYSGQISEDRAFIKSRLSGLEDRQLKEMITDYLTKKK